MRKKINVIDLDKTLISVDSFREFIFYFSSFKSIPFLIYILTIRKLRLISMGKFKLKIIKKYRKQKTYKNKTIEFANFLFTKLNQDIFTKIKKNSDTNTINILCSASPSDYVKPFAELLKWEYISTEIYENNFYHNYGDNKLAKIMELYPKDTYHYNYAISDHNSDISLLKQFKTFDLIKS